MSELNLRPLFRKYEHIEDDELIDKVYNLDETETALKMLEEYQERREEVKQYKKDIAFNKIIYIGFILFLLSIILYKYYMG